MKSIFLLVIMLSLAACSGGAIETLSDEIIQTAIGQTLAAQPTNTQMPPTPIVLSEIDLVPLLIQQGDLPAGSRNTAPSLGFIFTPPHVLKSRLGRRATKGE